MKKLSATQLDQFCIGSQSTSAVDGKWSAERFPARLRPAYDDPPRFGVRRDCPSAVRLRFLTNSTRVELAMSLGASADPVFQGAIVVDSEPPRAFGPARETASWTDAVFTQTSRDFRLIDLWLPHLVKVKIDAIRIDDDCEVKPAPKLPVRWLAYGDSITQGFCASIPTSTAIARCALSLKAALTCLAVGGSTLKPALADALPSGQFDLITIAYGACDFQENVRLHDLLRNARRLIDALHASWPGAVIVVITPLRWPATPTSPAVNGINLTPQSYRDALASLKGKHPRLHIVEGEPLVDPIAKTFADWIHPNDAGFEQYARNLLPLLRKVFL